MKDEIRNKEGMLKQLKTNLASKTQEDADLEEDLKEKDQIIRDLEA